MTMPKFEPVAKVLVIDEVGRELVFNLQKPLHTADQLTEAYEAGKRDAVPEGLVLVPKEPTEEMLIAGRETPCTASDEDWRDDYVDVYKSMIAAAPKELK